MARIMMATMLSTATRRAARARRTAYDSESGSLSVPTTYTSRALGRYVRLQRHDGREVVTVEIEVFGY
jgi:hypothetical protein